MKFKIFVAIVVCSIWSSWVKAGNVTIVHTFTGAEDTMPISQATDENTCWPIDPPAFLPFVELGQISVSQSGEYRVADLWIWTEAPTTVKGSLDTVLLIYDGPFDDRRPATNLVAVFDYGEWNQINGEPWVQLESTTNYRLVLQKACDAKPGIGGFAIRGPGEITGVGVPTSTRYYGDFSDIPNSNSADFEDWGFHKFADPYMVQATRSGYYRFVDLSPGVGGGNVGVRIYSAPFDPQDPSANLLAAADINWPWAVAVYLQPGQAIYVVQVDIYDSDTVFQTIMHVPGELAGITSDFVGTYFNPAQKGQGVLVDMDDNFEFLFAAMFTYTNTPVTLESDRGAGKQAVGSTDQRWLTAYGPFSEDSTEMDLTFEMMSGGRFNSMEPAADREDVYGSGKLVAHDCERIDIHYSLPHGDGVFNLSRLLPGFIQDCATDVPVGEPVP